MQLHKYQWKPECHVNFISEYFVIRSIEVLRYRTETRAYSREYGLMTEAHAQLSVVRNCSSEGETAGGRGWSAVAGGGGRTDSAQGERIWSSFQRQKVERGLLLLIHILWPTVSSSGKKFFRNSRTNILS
jgi:hypothetical protein